MLPQQYCLRWKYHHSNLQTMFSQLLDRGCFCDVTLACEGQIIRAHRVVLCACSTFFDTLLTNYATEPIIIMKDAKFSDVKCLIEFMYKGEINVEHSNLASLLKTAEDLKIKGLAEVSWREDEFSAEVPEPEQKFHEGILPPPLTPPIVQPQQEQQSLLPVQLPLQQQQQQHQTQPLPAPLIPPTTTALAGLVAAATTTTTTTTTTPPAAPAILLSKDNHINTDGLLNSIPQHRIPRMPLLTPIPSPVLQQDNFGQKRKRGRPPLDDSYDVFSSPKISFIKGTGIGSTNNNNNNNNNNHNNNNHNNNNNNNNNNNCNNNTQLPFRDSPVALDNNQQIEEEIESPKYQQLSADSQSPTRTLIPTTSTITSPPATTTTTTAGASAAGGGGGTGGTGAITSTAILTTTTTTTATITAAAATTTTTTNPIHDNCQTTATTNDINHDWIKTNDNDSDNETDFHQQQQQQQQQQHNNEQLPHHSTKHELKHEQHNDDYDYYDQKSEPTLDDLDSENGIMNVALTTAELEEWKDVIKMDAYLSRGRRPQFWEEPFTKRVMDAIKSKKLEMKKAAQVLGVSYGTLYGRYRETYGCLKHPYRNQQYYTKRLRGALATIRRCEEVLTVHSDNNFQDLTATELQHHQLENNK